MKLKLFAKLFLLLLLSMLLLLGSVMVFVHLNFKQGLIDYLQKTEMEKLQQLAGQLGDYYQQHQGWQDLRHNPDAWFDLIKHSAIAKTPPNTSADEPTTDAGETEDFPPPPLPPPPPVFDDAGFSPPVFLRPPPSHRRLHLARKPPSHTLSLDIDRLFVVDAEGYRVVGPLEQRAVVEGERKMPVMVADQTVGWLFVRPNPLITDQLAVDFMQQQLTASLWILSVALAVSILMALIMARQILRPLRRIAHGIDALAAGRFETQIVERGHDELAALAKDVNLLGRTLAHGERARQQWIADISHELRTPLSVLRGELEALVDGIRLNTPERIVSLHQEVLALARLVDDLYQLSLSDLGALDYQFERIELTAHVTHLVDSFLARFAGKNIQLSVQAPKVPVWVKGDSTRLTQLFSNLLENSYRYTDGNGVCQVSLMLQAQTVMVAIDDSAPGVSDEELPLLFERFHRVETSRRRQTGGAGLGLAICSNIVAAHDGRIVATASKLGGVRMTVTLPLSLG